MKLRDKTFALVAILLLGVFSHSQAQDTLLFDGGPPDGDRGLRISDISLFVAADDFVATEKWQINRVEFWSVEMDGGFTWDGTLRYFIFEDLNGEPKQNYLFSGQGEYITKEEDSDVVTIYTGYKYNFKPDKEVILEKDKIYWLALNLGGVDDQVQAFWASTSFNILSDARISGDLTVWSEYWFGLAFRLYGVDISRLKDVAVDVMPNNCPNKISSKKRGRLPVAILGDDDFDVKTIDIATIRLENVAPIKSSFEDVATPFLPYIGKENPDDCLAAGKDGYEDLTLKFDFQEVFATMGGQVPEGPTVMTLTGKHLEEFGGSLFKGEDVVIVK